MYLEDILSKLKVDYKLVSNSKISEVLVKGISFNSKTVKPGEIFVCLVGENFDAHNFVADAVNKGASAILAQRNLDNISVPVVVVENTAMIMAKISTIFYDYPSQKMRLVGITGTNGKTTVTHLVEKIFEKAQKQCGLIGTLGHRFSSADKHINSKHTTPQAPDLQLYLNEMVKKKYDYTVMEVSSHALDLYRVLGCDFAIALMTNITQDHLDFHVTMENYAKAKLKLFSQLSDSKVDNKFAIINKDDPMSEKFLFVVGGNIKLLTYGITSDADIKAVDIEHNLEGTRFNCQSSYGSFPVKLKLKGMFSVYNALSAISIALAENITMDVITEALYNIENIPGRFEAISNKPLVIVDYAHTPDGLSNVLATARHLVLNGGKLITVFGCGGDRDPTKRPKMAKIVEYLSDKIVVTSDNPRTEDPQQIITDILTGIKNLDSEHVKVEIDRASAIEIAIKEAGKHDVVVVAGKGHEDYQILADKTIYFDDREVVRDVISKLSKCKAGG